MKKLLSILMLLVAIVTGAWAAITPKTITSSAGEVYLVTPANMYSYYNSGNGWATNASGGAISSTSYYQSKTGTSNTNYINPETEESGTTGQASGITLKTNDNRSARFYFTGAIKVYAFTASTSTSRSSSLTVYKASDDTQVGTFSENASGGSYHKLTVTGLTASESYYAKVTATNDMCFYAMKFFAPSAPSVPTLTGAWKIGEDDVTGETADVVQGATAPSIPTFTVGATSGTPTSSDYQVAYEETGDEGIFTYTGDVPTGISTANAGSATITATLTTKDDTKYLTPETNTFTYTVTVSEAQAPSIDVSGTPAEVVKVGTEVTLTATAAGVPTPTITWYNGSDEAVATVVGTVLAYPVPTTTAGTYTFYAVASNGVEPNAISAVQTVVVKEQVAKPTISPASKKFTESVTMTASSTTEGAAFVYSVDGGATWNALPNGGVEFTATTTAQVKATNTDYIDSEVATATYTLFVPTELVTISEATTWDFADLSGGKQFSGDDLNTEFVYTDIDGVSVASGKTFNTDAIAFKGEYPLRSGQKASQNGTLRFNTSVAGTITVTFSDTGSSGSNPKRYLNVNGVNTEYYTQRTGTANDKKTSGEIVVPAGDVTIKGMGDDGETLRAIMVYKIVFTPFAAQDVTVGETGFATVGLPFATTVPAGVTAYAVESVSDSKVKMSSAIETGTTIPANKGFVIVAAPNTYKFSQTGAGTWSGSNLLEAVGETPKAATTEAPIYVLAVTGEKKVGFKKATSGSLGAYKAYLPGTVSNQTSLSVSFDDETAVEAIAEANEANAEAPVKVVKNGKLFIGNYNVAGQQVK